MKTAYLDAFSGLSGDMPVGGDSELQRRGKGCAMKTAYLDAFSG